MPHPQQKFADLGFLVPQFVQNMNPPGVVFAATSLLVAVELVDGTLLVVTFVLAGAALSVVSLVLVEATLFAATSGVVDIALLLLTLPFAGT